jgi:hypothetical protein
VIENGQSLGSAPLLFEDAVMHKMSKIELRKGFVVVSTLEISKKNPLASFGGKRKN